MCLLSFLKCLDGPDIVSFVECNALWSELKFDPTTMLSRRGLYRTKRGTILYRLRWMSPYNIELIARNPALKIQI